MNLGNRPRVRRLRKSWTGEQEKAANALVRWAVLCRDERDAARARMLVERSRRVATEDRVREPARQ